MLSTDTFKLDDLEGGDLSLDDISVEKTKPVVFGDRSNKLLATNTAMVSGNPEGVFDSLKAMDEEFSAEGQSETQAGLQEGAINSSVDLATKALPELILDNGISDEAKLTTSLEVTDPESDFHNTRKQLSVTALSADNGEGNAEIARSTFSLVNILDDVAEDNLGKTALMNSVASSRNNSTVKTMAELVSTMIPFSESVIINRIGAELSERLPDDLNYEHSTLQSFYALGHQKEDIQEALRNFPRERRGEVQTLLMEIIEGNTSLVLPDTNHYRTVELARTFLEEDYYEDTEKWIDTAIGILDLAVFGRLASKAIKGVKAVRKTRSEAEVRDRLNQMTFGDKAVPTSAGVNLEQTNATLARSTYQKAVGDEAASEALYGTDTANLAAGRTLPDPISSDGVVASRPSNMNLVDEVAPDPRLEKAAEETGHIYISKEAKAKKLAQVKNDFKGAFDLSLRDNTMQLGYSDDAISIHAVYGPNPNTGWETAQDALDHAGAAMRRYGVDFEVLVKRGEGYVPLKSVTEDIPHHGDYLVKAKFKDEFNSLDAFSMAEADPTYNFLQKPLVGFGRAIKNELGSWNVGLRNKVPIINYLLDPSSLYSPTHTKASFIAEDRAGGLERLLTSTLNDFEKGFDKLSLGSQTRVAEHIREANHNNIKFDRNNLFNQGFSNEEIDSLAIWQKNSNNLYLLDNKDLTRTYKAQGWEAWSKDDTYLITRPIEDRNTAGSVKRAYNPDTDEMVSLSKDDLDKLYEEGGVVSKLKTPYKSGEDAEHIIVAQKAGNFTRPIRESDGVLPYRNMHFTVRYKNPWFIDKHTIGKDGKVRIETLATSPNSKAAALERSRLAKVDEDGAEFVVREDRLVGRSLGEDYVNLSIARGRNSQKVRGQRLTSGSSETEGLDHAHIEDPVSSVVKSIKSLANRTSYRDFMDTSKREWLEKYSRFLHHDGGALQYPTNLDAIKKIDVTDKAEWDAARSMWQRLDYLEKGYVNSIDELYKGALRKLADTVGGIEATGRGAAVSAKGEEALRAASNFRPLSFSKNVAFKLLLEYAPIRQIIVQGHQSIMLFADNPKWFVKSSHRQLGGLVAYKSASMKKAGRAREDALNKASAFFGQSRKEMDDMMRQFDESGMASSMDRHTMARGALTEMTESWGHSKVSRAGGKVKKALRAVNTLPKKVGVDSSVTKLASKAESIPKKVGFEAGEFINMSTAWLSFRDKAIRAGKDITRTSEQADVAAQTRNFTGGMNFAGDLPQNQNTLSALFQFQAAPHKLLLAMTTNKITTPRQKAAMAAFYLPMFTLPPALMYDWFPDTLASIENEEVRDAVVFGLETQILNKTLEFITGENPEMDFSSLAPTDIHGLFGTITSMATDGFFKTVANTPALSLTIGHNPKITDAFRTASRVFHPTDDGVESTEDWLTVVESVLKTGSGFSRGMAAYLAFESGKKISASGKEQDYTKLQSILSSAGFNTIEETQTFLFDKKLYNKKQEIRDDVDNWFKRTKRQLAGEGISTQDGRFEMRVLNMAIRYFDDHGEDWREQILLQKLKKEVTDGDVKMWRGVQSVMGIMETSEVMGFLQGAPIGDEAREHLMKQVEVLEKLDYRKDELEEPDTGSALGVMNKETERRIRASKEDNE